MSKNTKGFKVFNPDWTCRGFQYEVGNVYSMDDTPKCCEIGFHFCTKAADCFNYYNFEPNNKVAEVEALGEIDTDGSKSCTNKIKIVREIPWDELLKIINVGKSNTGLCNTGDYNSGDWNSGDYNSGNHNSDNYNSGNHNSGYYNTGNWNSGNHNSGNRNTGDCNSGNRNTGYHNSGNWNSGDRNSGDRNSGNWNTGYRNSGNWNSGNHNSGDCNSGYYNSGYYNTGDYNTGDYNTGNYNSGYCNTGDYNTGDHNTGDHNSGDWNTGYRNTGDYNSGDYNTGDCNKSSFNNGCFNTVEPTIMMFNKPSKITYKEWLSSDARQLLSQMPKDSKWIYSDNMTDEEKTAHPTYETTGGYLKLSDAVQSRQIWWDGLSDEQKEIIRDIPNFDPEVFEKCTGIKTE